MLALPPWYPDLSQSAGVPAHPIGSSPSFVRMGHHAGMAGGWSILQRQISSAGEFFRKT